MKRAAIRELVETRLSEIGVPKTRLLVREVPSCVEVQVIVGADRIIRRFEPGTMKNDIEREMGRLAGLLDREKERHASDGQIDLEDAIAAKS
jgi:hypothetical protein